MRVEKGKLYKNEIDGRWRLSVPGYYDPSFEKDDKLIEFYAYLPVAESAPDLCSTGQNGCGYASGLTNADLAQSGVPRTIYLESQISPEGYVPPQESPGGTTGGGNGTDAGTDFDITQDPFWKFYFGGGVSGTAAGAINGMNVMFLSVGNPRFLNMMVQEDAKPAIRRTASAFADAPTSAEQTSPSEPRSKLATSYWCWMFFHEEHEDNPIIYGKADIGAFIVVSETGPTEEESAQIKPFPWVQPDNGLTYKDSLFTWFRPYIDRFREMSFAKHQYQRTNLVQPNYRIPIMTSTTISRTHEDCSKANGLVKSAIASQSSKYHPQNVAYQFGYDQAIPLYRHGWWAEDWLGDTDYFRHNTNALWDRDSKVDIQVYPHGIKNGVMQIDLYEYQLDYTDDKRVSTAETGEIGSLVSNVPETFRSVNLPSTQSISTSFGFNNQGFMYNGVYSQTLQNELQARYRDYIYPVTSMKRYVRKNSIVNLSATLGSGQIFMDGKDVPLYDAYQLGSATQWKIKTIDLYGAVEPDKTKWPTQDPEHYSFFAIIGDKFIYTYNNKSYDLTSMAERYAAGGAFKCVSLNLYDKTVPEYVNETLPTGETYDTWGRKNGGVGASGSAGLVYYNGMKFEKTCTITVKDVPDGTTKITKTAIVFTCYANGNEIWWHNKDQVWTNPIVNEPFIVGEGYTPVNMKFTTANLQAISINTHVLTNGWDNYKDWNIVITFVPDGSCDFTCSTAAMYQSAGTPIDESTLEALRKNPLNRWIPSDMQGEVYGRNNVQYQEDVYALMIGMERTGNWRYGADGTLFSFKNGTVLGQNWSAEFPRMRIVNLPSSGVIDAKEAAVVKCYYPHADVTQTGNLNLQQVQVFQNDGQASIYVNKYSGAPMRIRKSLPCVCPRIKSDWIGITYSTALVEKEVVCLKNSSATDKNSYPLISSSGQLFPLELFNADIHEKKKLKLNEVTLTIKASENKRDYDRICAVRLDPFYRSAIVMPGDYLDEAALQEVGAGGALGTRGFINIKQELYPSTSIDPQPTAFFCTFFVRQPKSVQKVTTADCVKGKLQPVKIETHTKSFSWGPETTVDNQWITFTFDKMQKSSRSFFTIKVFKNPSQTSGQTSGQTPGQTSGQVSGTAYSDRGFPGQLLVKTETPIAKGDELDYSKYEPAIVRIWQDNVPLFEPRFLMNEPEIVGADDDGATLKRTMAANQAAHSMYADDHYQLLSRDPYRVLRTPYFYQDSRSSSKPMVVGGAETILNCNDSGKGRMRIQAPMVVFNARKILIHQADAARQPASISTETNEWCDEQTDNECTCKDSSCCDACAIRPMLNQWVDFAFNIQLTERTDSSNKLLDFLYKIDPQGILDVMDDGQQCPASIAWTAKYTDWVKDFRKKVQDAVDDTGGNAALRAIEVQKKFFAWYNYYRQHTFKTAIMYGSTRNGIGPRYYDWHGNEHYPDKYHKYGQGRAFNFVPTDFSLRGCDSIMPRPIINALDWQWLGFNTEDLRKQPFNYYPIGK